MTLAPVPLVYTVYVDNSCVDEWVTDLDLEQDEEIYDTFSVTLSVWHNMPIDGSWDIFSSLDPDTNPRANVEIVNGVIPRDRAAGTIVVDKTHPPRLKLTGHDWVWKALRRNSSETIIMIPGLTGWGEGWVEQAVANYRDEHGDAAVVGIRRRVWQRVLTLHDAIEKLSAAAGLRVRVLLPNYPMQPRVVPPGQAYWRTIQDLVAPFAPEASYGRLGNTVIIADSPSHLMGGGNAMTIPDELLDKVTYNPVKRKRARRVLMRIPKWR